MSSGSRSPSNTCSRSLRCGDQGLKFRVQGLELGLGNGVWDSGCMVWGLWFGYEGSWFTGKINGL